MKKDKNLLHKLGIETLDPETPLYEVDDGVIALNMIIWTLVAIGILAMIVRLAIYLINC